MSQAEPPAFDLFTTLRYDPALLAFSIEGPPSPFLLLPLHLDRLLETAKHFEWQHALQTISGERASVLSDLHKLCLETAHKEVNGGGKNPLRITVILSYNGTLRAEAFPTPAYPFHPLSLSTFSPPTPPTQSDLSGPDSNQAIINNPDNQPIIHVVLDTEPTPSSPYTAYKTTIRAHYDAARARAGIASPLKEVLLFDEEGYITEGSVRNVAFWRDGQWVSPVRGGLKGTVRKLLLERGNWHEGDVKREEVSKGQVVMLTNGVEGCRLGVIH